MKFAGGEIRENWLILAYSAFVTTEISRRQISLYFETSIRKTPEEVLSELRGWWPTVNIFDADPEEEEEGEGDWEV